MSKVIQFPPPPVDENSVGRMLEDLNKLHAEGKLKHFIVILTRDDDSSSVWRSFMPDSDACLALQLMQHRITRDFDDRWLGSEVVS